MFDYLIVGAGFSGSVLAERLASVGQRVLLTDRRAHVGGNAYDHHDEHGVLVHKYGPHIFHTNCERIYRYLSRFTAWRHYEHRVLSHVDGMHLPFPINADTISTLLGVQMSEAEVEAYLQSVAEPIAHPRTFEEAVTSKIGRELFDKFIRNYTRKQWGIDPADLDASVAARVPARTNRDSRYFTDKFQVMPLHGYTRMFERMLGHRNITLLLQADFRDVCHEVSFKNVVYTGPIDEYFDYCYGKLPYRSLRFEFKTENCAQFQPGPVVNFPNEHDYTRVTEFKYLTGQEHRRTSLVYEYPTGEGDPYYPIPQAKNAALYARYKKLANETPNVTFVGRLGTYRYYNMDQCVGQALAVFDRMRGHHTSEDRVDAA